jgi:hypothetical protein
MNALALYDILKGNEIVINGMTAGNGVQAGESSGEQRLRRTSDTNNGVTGPAVFFPFVGVQLTASMNVVSNDQGTQTIGIRFLNAAGGTISTSTGSVSGTGLNSHTAVTPALTAYIQFVTNVGNTVDDDFTFSKPMLALGTLTQFTI